MKKKNLNIEKAEIKAFLGPGSQFEGKLSFDEMVRLDGRFVGEIRSSDSLVVGDTAEIEGDIHVGCLVLSGNFKGNIVASQSVALLEPAKVEGVIETPLLKIDEKVIFNGEIRMTTPIIVETETKK